MYYRICSNCKKEFKTLDHRQKYCGGKCFYNKNTIDITGKKFNRWTAIKFIKREGRTHYWLFKCFCGIERVLRKGNITGKKSRSRSCGCIKMKNKNSNDLNLLNNKQWLKQKYLKENLSGKQIAKLCRVNEQVVFKKLRNFKIMVRSIKRQWGFKKFKDKKWLESAVKKYTIRKIAALCKSNPATIKRQAKKFDIKYKVIFTKKIQKKLSKIRSITASKMVGKKHPNWTGGESPLRCKAPWTQQKNKALKRDDFTCQICGKEKKDNFGIELDVHHKVKFKFFKNYKNAHNLKNLITLCKACHYTEESKKTIRNVKFGKNPKVWNYVNLFDCEFGDNVSIGSFTEIYGAKIGNNVRFQAHCFVPKGTVIEDSVFFSPNVVILNDKRPPSHGKYWEKAIICKGAVIGGSCTILPGVIIGKNSMVGAGSVVTKDIPEGEVWLGSPAKFYKKREDL